jgi:hypothetical protein
MEDYKIYEIHEILAAASNYIENPEDTERKGVLDEIKTNLMIKPYMPLKQKEICLRKMIIDIRSEVDAPYSFAAGYEISLFFNCLLAYVINLDTDINVYYKDSDFYDLLHISGLCDYILSFCNDDYQELKRMADRMIAFDNLANLMNDIKITSPEQIERLTKEFENFSSVETNSKVLSQLSAIAAANDPLLMEIKKSIEDKAFEEANKKE